MNGYPQQFRFVLRDPSRGQASLAPMLPLILIWRQRVTASGLVDSGAAVNVLPHAVGLQLGFDWDQQTQSVTLSGNLAPVGARVLVMSAVVGNFPPVRLAVARARTDEVSVILGQLNFFLEFSGRRSALRSAARPASGAGVSSTSPTASSATSLAA